jgi:hypothetical protein
MPIEERGLGSRSTQQVGTGRRLGNLRTPISVQKLQTALHAKAKEEQGSRQGGKSATPINTYMMSLN